MKLRQRGTVLVKSGVDELLLIQNFPILSHPNRWLQATHTASCFSPFFFVVVVAVTQGWRFFFSAKGCLDIYSIIYGLYQTINLKISLLQIYQTCSPSCSWLPWQCQSKSNDISYCLQPVSLKGIALCPLVCQPQKLQKYSHSF